MNKRFIELIRQKIYNEALVLKKQYDDVMQTFSSNVKKLPPTEETEYNEQFYITVKLHYPYSLPPYSSERIGYLFHRAQFKYFKKSTIPKKPALFKNLNECFNVAGKDKHFSVFLDNFHLDVLLGRVLPNYGLFVEMGVYQDSPCKKYLKLDHCHTCMNAINTNPSTKKEKRVKVVDKGRIKLIETIYHNQVEDSNIVANEFVVKIYENLDDKKEEEETKNDDEEEEETKHLWKRNCFIAIKFIHPGHYECLRMFDFKSNTLSINTFQRKIYL
jgi:hypothetical protein